MVICWKCKKAKATNVFEYNKVCKKCQEKLKQAKYEKKRRAHEKRQKDLKQTYSITLTEAKKKLRGITTDELIKKVKQMKSDYYQYDGDYGVVRIFKKKDIDKIAKNWKTPEKFRKEQREKAKEYRVWKKAREEVGFFCDECDEFIEGRADSSAVIAYMEGEITKKECIKLIKKAHDRHEHTDYDEIREKEVEKLRKAGWSWEDAHAEARQVARQLI